jgi:hypothetical protein
MNKMKSKLYFIIIALTIGYYSVALAGTELSVKEYGDYIHLALKDDTDPPIMYEYYGILYFVVHTFLQSEILPFFLTFATSCSVKEFYT